MITKKTKVISIAHVTNVLGDIRPVEEIGKLCKENDIIFVVDGAQSVPHMKVDFKNSDIDFLSFSGHKMCGPTGVGCLVVKKKYLDKMNPLCYGGGMNSFFEEDNSYELKSIPTEVKEEEKIDKWKKMVTMKGKRPLALLCAEAVHQSGKGRLHSDERHCSGIPGRQRLSGDDWRNGLPL